MEPTFAEEDRRADETLVIQLLLATKILAKSQTYNKVARTLVALEYLWYEAWCRSVESATGLQATLIIRHPDTKVVR